MPPPAAASRLLARVLREDPAGPAILGDLHEEFVRIHQVRGPGAAQRWYWREAILFSLGRWLREEAREPSGRSGNRRPLSLQGAGAGCRSGPPIRPTDSGVLAVHGPCDGPGGGSCCRGIQRAKAPLLRASPLPGPRGAGLDLLPGNHRRCLPLRHDLPVREPAGFPGAGPHLRRAHGLQRLLGADGVHPHRARGTRSGWWASQWPTISFRSWGWNPYTEGVSRRKRGCGEAPRRCFFPTTTGGAASTRNPGWLETPSS